jgi:hypothetical protein
MQILARKEEIAARYPGRWIVHTDADEFRLSPWRGVSFADGLAIVQAYGASRVDFTLLNFRPTTHHSFRDSPADLPLYEYGDKPGHFVQKKAWRQPPTRIALADSGGHLAQFPDTFDFPYKFILKHYPIRSTAHGRRKTLHEREARWDPVERTKGWHVQYNHFDEDSTFLFDDHQLRRFNENTLLDELPVLISDLSWSADIQDLT